MIVLKILVKCSKKEQLKECVRAKSKKLLYCYYSLKFIIIQIFPVWLLNRSKSAGLELSSAILKNHV